MRIFEELQSGDLYVPRSEQYDDYRAHFMEEKAFQAELPLYTELVGLPHDGPAFAEQLRLGLTALAEAIDRDFPANDSVAWGPNGLVIRKVEKKEPPQQLAALDALRAFAMVSSVAAASMLGSIKRSIVTFAFAKSMSASGNCRISRTTPRSELCSRTGEGCCACTG